MKKLLFVFAVAAFTACGNSDTTKTETDTTKTVVTDTTTKMAAPADTMKMAAPADTSKMAPMKKDTAKKM